MRRPRRRVVWQLLVPLLVGYAALVLLALLVADRLIFQPSPPPHTVPAGVQRLALPGGGWLATLYLPRPGARYTLLYSHGNAEDLRHVRPHLEQLRAAGFSVFAYDYSGYGASSGAPSEAAVYRNAADAYRHMVARLGIPPERIVAYGRSLGGAAALDVAAHFSVAGVILESTFVSTFRVVTRVPLLPFDRFPNLPKVRRLNRPVLVIHGTADEVVPFAHGQRLYQAAPGPKQALWVPGAGHNNLPEVAGESYGRALRHFARLLNASANPTPSVPHAPL